jgi:regulator of cell morphogenesis and NO signaling
MPDHTVDRTLAEIVNTEPAATRVLESFGLDYCCGGGRTLEVACSSIGVDPVDILEAIAELAPAPVADWASMDPVELVDHIESTHHAYLHTELERLDELLDKVAAAHGTRHVELDGIGATYRLLRADLEPHLQKEERVLFPMIRQLATATEPPTFHCGSINNPITVMMSEHDRAGELLESLRLLTGDYTAPPDGCASYRALFDGLARLERDTHLHVHKENNLVFPAVVELERRWTGAPS